MRILIKFVCVFFIMNTAKADISDANYLQELIGVWAMEPTDKPKKGIANVTEFRSDGSYHLHAFKCTGDDKYISENDLDSKGTWTVENGMIISTITDSKELKSLEETVKQIKEDLAAMKPKEKEMMLNMLGKDMKDFIEGKPPTTREKIISIDGDVMKSEQEYIFNKSYKYVSKKVSNVKPLCQQYK